MNEQTELLREMRDLLLVIAEPALAKRDQKLREELLRLVGRSLAKQKSVFLMDGNHTQAAIRKKTEVNQGDLSTLVKKLVQNSLLLGDPKQPKLAISIPSNFFES